MKPICSWIFSVLLAMGSILAHGGEPPLFSNFFWEDGSFSVQDNVGWQRRGILPRTFTASIRHIRNHLEGRGFRELHSMEDKRDGKKHLLSLWVKGNHRLMLMVVQLDTDRTLVTWGDVTEDNLRQRPSKPQIDSADNNIKNKQHEKLK
jgi:hypothetical protein